MADCDGDAKADVAVFRPSDSTWYLYPADPEMIVFGNPGMNIPIPLPGAIRRTFFP